MGKNFLRYTFYPGVQYGQLSIRQDNLRPRAKEASYTTEWS